MKRAGRTLLWAEVDARCKELHHDFERAPAETKLPERPDYEAANRILIKARRQATITASEPFGG